MTYIIKCCNCYFDMYLVEINRWPKIMNPEKLNLLNIIRIKDVKTERKSNDDIPKQWFLIEREIAFNSCFDSVYKALQISSYRTKPTNFSDP